MTYVEELAARIRDRVAADLVPDDPEVDRLFLIYAAMGLAKGQAITRRNVHDAWAAWMAGHDPTHESIKPFEQLESDTKEEDDPFVAAIRGAVADDPNVE